jgi:hypothetical protein
VLEADDVAGHRDDALEEAEAGRQIAALVDELANVGGDSQGDSRMKSGAAIWPKPVDASGHAGGDVDGKPGGQLSARHRKADGDGPRREEDSGGPG